MTNYEKWKAEQSAIERLLEEIQRLAKVYAGNQIALGVLQLGNRRNSRTSRVE